MKGLLYLSIFTAAVVISWIIFGIYHNNTTSTISRDKELIITPIPPNFDEETVNKIKLRKIVEADLSSGKRTASGSSTIAEEEPLPLPTQVSPTTTPIATPAVLPPAGLGL
jgi:hypothetical protein